MKPIIILTLIIFNITFLSCKQEKPNILFCIGDDITWKHMGAYGCQWVNTPAFDFVAKNGILFNNAYTSNAKCSPSRASIMTGRNSWQLEEACNHMPTWPEKFISYHEVLDRNGYHVGYTGKGYAPGVVKPINGKARNLLVNNYSQHKMKVPSKGISTIDYATNFEAFLNDRADNTPFCFWYGCNEPHRKYEYGSGVRLGNKNVEMINGKVPKFWADVDSVRNDLLDYAFEIEWFDSHLQKMINLLKEKKILDNTLIVVTADNGMPFPRVKGQAYEYSNHLPLAIMWGKKIKNPGRVIDDLVNFADFAPTFLEVAGLRGEKNGMAPIWGHSFCEYFSTEKEGTVNPERNFMLIGKERHDLGRPHDWGYPIRGIVQDSLLLIHNFEPTRWPAGNPETGYLNCDASPTKTVTLKTRKKPDLRKYWLMNFGPRTAFELYNIKKDPECIYNLADKDSYAERVQSMNQKMIEELKNQKDPRVLCRGSIFDEYETGFIKFLNLYERHMNGEKINMGWVIPSDFEPNFYEEEKGYSPE